MNLQKIELILRSYRAFRIQHPDTWIEFTMQQRTLSEAIEVAALAVDMNGKRNPHQRRRSIQTLMDFRDALLEKRGFLVKQNILMKYFH